MKIYKSIDGYRACLSPKELAQMMINSYFTKLFSNKILQDKSYDSEEVKEYISELSNNTIDSKEYEYFVALLDLYHTFDKECDFIFNLKNYNPNKHIINTIEKLEDFKDDPPDVIVKYKNVDYPFELKRYRGKVAFDDIYIFTKKKIIDHYSGKMNFLVIIQPNIDIQIDLGVFDKIHEKLSKEDNQPGYIGFSFNHDNKEIITVRVLPELNIYSRPYNSETDLFSNILHL